MTSAVTENFTEIISEEAFLPLVEKHAQSFLNLHYVLEKNGNSRSRKFYAYLAAEADDLESFLDDHGARENRRWHFFVELVASVRNLSTVAFILKHVAGRYPTYAVLTADQSRLNADALHILDLFGKATLSLLEMAGEEANLLGMHLSGELSPIQFGNNGYRQKRLPNTMDEDGNGDALMIAGKLASKYLNIHDDFESLKWRPLIDAEDLLERIPWHISEESAREIGSRLHNLQSIYDHHLRHSHLEIQDSHLKTFRACITVPLHLLRIVELLSHFYQRHILVDRGMDAPRRISAVMEEHGVVEKALRFSLLVSGWRLDMGKEIAKSLLEQYTVTDMIELHVPKGHGFHMRPATLVAKVAQHYGTTLLLYVDGQEFDAHSVLSLNIAGGYISKERFKTIRFKGDVRALGALKVLAEHNYGEDEKGNPIPLPERLLHILH